jgi:drug/metabolite transporter (DMT)-like permease
LSLIGHPAQDASVLIFIGLCLLSRVAYALNDVLTGQQAREGSALEVAAWRGVSLGLSMLPLVFFAKAGSWEALAGRGWELLLAWILTGMSNTCLMRSGQLLPFGLRGGIVISGVVTGSLVVGWFALNERLGSLQLFCCLVLGLSALGAALGDHTTPSLKPQIVSGTIWSLLSAFFIVGATFIVRRLANEVDPFLVGWAWEFGVGLVLLFPLAWQYRKTGITPWRRIVKIAWASSPTAIGTGASMVALTQGALGLWAALSGTQVLFTAFLGWLWHQERIGFWRWVAFGAIASAVAGLAIAGKTG